MRPHKYGAKKVSVDGMNFPSKREAKRWLELQLLSKAGEIKDLRRQAKIALLGRSDIIRTPTGRAAYYVADFIYIDNRTGLEVIEDAKGYPTPEYKLKRAILAAQGVTIVEV